MKKAEDLEEGDDCPMCGGTMGYEPVVDCYCHISPPCGKCVDNPLVCLDCGSTVEDIEKDMNK